MSNRPNILLFVCDDLRFDALGCMGDPMVQTPNLDRLAADGVCFEQCYMPGGSSPAVCMPSRAMIHSGRSLFHIEREGQRIPEEHITLAEHLKVAGYHTHHIGKWHNCRESLARGFVGGDEIFIGGMADQWNMSLYRFDPSGKFDARIPYIQAPLQEKTVQYRNGDHTTEGRHSTDVFIDAGQRFSESHDKGEPFFLSVALTAPHDPRSAPKEFHDLYDHEQVTLPSNFVAQHPHDTGFLPGVTSTGDRYVARDESLADMPRRPDEIREHIADYYAMISHLDHGFGRLRRSLEANSQWDDTIVIFTSDHGLAVGQHGLMGKQSVYEHSVRVPLIMAGPGIPKRLRPKATVLHFDIFRTLCELLDLETPVTVEGDSLKPVWEGSTGRESVYLAYGRSIRGLTESGHKLIEYAGPEGYRATQLFDLGSDSCETFDLAHSPGHQDMVSSMHKRMVEISRGNGDRESEVGKGFWGNWG